MCQCSNLLGIPLKIDEYVIEKTCSWALLQQHFYFILSSIGKLSYSANSMAI